MSYQRKTDPIDANGDDPGGRQRTDVTGDALDTSFCITCDKSPCNKETEYWGVCPVCHASPRWLNIGADHWCYCPQHQVKWVVGANVFSSWMHETKEEQRAKFDALNFGSYTVVDDVPCPHSDYSPEERAADQASNGPFIDES